MDGLHGPHIPLLTPCSRIIYIYIILDIPAGSESVLINFVYMLLFFKA